MAFLLALCLHVSADTNAPIQAKLIGYRFEHGETYASIEITNTSSIEQRVWLPIMMKPDTTSTDSLASFSAFFERDIGLPLHPAKAMVTHVLIRPGDRPAWRMMIKFGSQPKSRRLMDVRPLDLWLGPLPRPLGSGSERSL
jgi:hypothetical protein